MLVRPLAARHKLLARSLSLAFAHRLWYSHRAQRSQPLCQLPSQLVGTFPTPSRGLELTGYDRRIDITEGIPKQAAVNFCKGCSRYLAPPTQWVICEMESRELLAICLRKLKGLAKVRLIDAGFIWTEPHSKRLRVKLTIQKEVSCFYKRGRGAGDAAAKGQKPRDERRAPS